MSLLQAASVGSSFSRILHTILGQPHVELQQLHAEQELAKSQLILPNKAAAFAHHDAETGHATWIPLDQVKQQISINLSGVGSVEPILITPSGIDSHLQALVAFFTLASQQRLDHNDELQLDESDYIRTSIDDLKQMLTSRLPSHMVPSFYVSLTYMPMTSSGAVDYCKLQTFFSRLPESLSPELDDSWAYVATPSASSDSYDRITETDTSHSSRHPTTPAEEKMRGLWASTFDISPEDIGLDDSFFLYGDSVSAMNLVAAARNVGLQLAVAQVFTSPTLADLAAAAVQLAEDEIRTELRAFELLTGNISVSEAIRIVAEQCEVGENRVEDMYPSTALQEGLMALTFTQQASYVFQCVCSLPASLDIERFKAAWVKVVRENEILRTRIVYLESVGTMQAVLHEDSIEWNSGSDLNDYLALDKAVPVEYGAPLTRFAIIGHPHQDHHFVWTIHHALYDAWSMSLILDAVDCVYGNSIKSGLTNVSFNRFVQHVANTDIDESKEFWTAYLLDANATLFPLPSLDDKIVRVNGTLSSKLDLQRTAASNITAATVIRAAWGAVVARYSDSDDVIFGSTLTGRNAPVPGINTVVGPTITTVPIRARIDRSMTFAQFLQTMQTDMIAMISYEHVGLQTLKRWGGFTQAACNFQNLLVIQLEHDRHAGKNHMGLDFDRRTRSGPENYSLMMECTLLETGIDIHVDYDQTLVSPQQMERIIRQFEHVLLQLNTESQTKTMADLEIFSSWDHQLVNTWNGKDLPTKMACVHELFEEVSKTQPAAQAICSWDVNLSYEELDQLSTTFALHLQDLGVTTETIVPSLFEKSAWAHVAHIATLKAGGAVVCLDPNHPEGRRKMILTDVRANVVLTSPAYAGLFRDVQHVVTVDADSMERLSRFTKPERPLKRIVQPSNAALVIYTSGSTGEPKGVVLEHASVCTGMQAHGDALRIGQQTRALNFSAYVFDASIEDTYTQLTRGGCICIPSEVQRLNDIAGAIRATNANWIGITPTTASTIDPSSVPTLDTLILGGERVPQTIVDRWKDSVTYMYNGYGPTEGTLYATLNPQLGKNGRSSNVGWGLHTKLWVVEPGNPDRLTPVGCSGELVIEGPQLARCYLNDPVKTNAAFIVDPAFSRNQDTTEPRRRMYRTGDLVRYCDDGSLEVIGRMDSQTKLHGQRLELGEIEHHLMSSNDIENAMAILSTDPQGTKRIMAIIALRALPGSELNTTDDFNLIIGDARKEIEPTITQIRKKLENNMPTYMVPTVWAIVDNIPRNTSQKIDRAGVTTWAASLDSETYLGLMGTGVEGVSALPINRMAALLRSVIGRVLNRPDEQLPVNRSFTNLGGDSITAMQVVAHCRAKGLRLFVKDILHSESIAQLSELVETMDGGGSVYKAHHKEPLDRVFALAPVQEMYFEAMGQKPTQFNQSFLLQVSRPVAIPELTAAVEAVVTRHSMLRARFLQQSDGRWRQLITADVATSYRFRVKELASPEEVAPAFLECQHGLDVEHGPLLGIDVLLMKDGSQLLALAAHHLVIDFVSWRVVLQDLEDYLITGSTAVERPFSFQNWTKLQAEYAHEHLDADVVLPFDIAVADFNYWGMTTELNTYGDVACHTFLLDRETTSLIFDKCNDAFSTEPVEILLAAAIHSFCQVFPDRQAPTVWREAHGRETWDAEIDLSSVVGWFTNLAPLHVQVVPDSDIVATARAVKDVSRKLPQNGWSYFTCRYLTEKGREKFKDHSPIELLFNYVGHFQQLERQDALFRMQPPRTDVLEPRVGADVPRMSLFEVSVSVIEGKLEFQIMYPSGMQRVAGIYHWAAAYDRTLREAAALLPVKEAEKTLSDFPLLPLGYSGLEALRSERVQQLGLSGLEDIETVYPCAPMQEALLVGQALHKGAYETNVTFEVTSTLRQTSVDVDRLQGAWEAVIAHHPMLRTVFMDSVANEGLYDQIVLRSFIGITHRVHCTDESGPATLDALEYMEQSTTEPLHRFIICTTPTKVFCRIDFHHATIDAASLRTLLDDMRLAYDGGLHHGARPEFSEYIKYLQTKSLSTAMDFWEDRLAEASPCHFPVSDGGGEKTMRTVDVHLDWIPALLRDFVSRTGVTLPNLVQTAWALVLHCYTGLDNISFGYLVGGRNLDVKDVDRIVGPLINMLVCNIDVAGSTNVIDLLHLARDQYAESLDYQHVSLGSVQHALGLSAGTPLFNTAMSSLHTSSTISKFQSRNAEAKQRQLFFDVMTFHDPTEYDITFTLKADDDNPMLSLVHWTPRVSDWLADNALASLTKVIQSLIDVAIADGPLSELEFFSERDRDLISQWNSTQVPAENTCIHHVFEQRVKETPSAEALCNADRSMTYLELDTFATRLALELQRHDIGPDVIVPLCFEKSSWAVVSMIAVMKAGGAFVPLDPSHPEFRLRQIIQSKGIYGKMILTSKAQISLFETLECETFVVDENTCNSLPTAAVTGANVAPHNLAYVIFTSGTTGKPKGTLIEHAAFTTNAREHSKILSINSSSRVLQFASYVFDASILEIFTTLMQGGTICIPTEEERGSMEIVGAINRMGVTWTLLTPSFATVIEPSKVPGLKTVVLGGEAMSKKHIDTWSPHVILINAYGPSESAVIASINADVQEASNIGHAVGALAWIADRNNSDRLVPVGAVGELLLEGPTLSRGYLNETAKTRAAFIDGPAWALGRRFYKTGDLVRYNPDGSLTYLGRKDTQVKVRGQRLEISEIENHLYASKLVKDAVVVMPSAGPRQKTLVGVVTLTALRAQSRNGKPLQVVDRSLQAGYVREISDKLGQTLPSYMVPPMWIVVEQMPLNTSGKLDRSRVSKWVERLGTDFYHRIAREDSLTGDPVEQPVTDMEAKIQELISNILNIPAKQVSSTQSFIGLGGDSITAMQMVSRCRGQGISLKMTDILRSKNIYKMAQSAKFAGIAQQQHTEASEVAFDLSPIQQMFTQMDGMPLRFNQSFFVRLARPTSLQSLSRAINSIVTRHSMLRARFFKSQDGNWRQLIKRDIHGSYHLQSHEIQSLDSAVPTMASSQRSLNPENGPLFSIDLFNVCGNGQFLYLVAHHLVIDMVSWRLVLQDLEQLLESSKALASDGLPFQSWCKLLSEYAGSQLQPKSALPFKIQAADFTYWDMESKPNTYADIERRNFSLDLSVSTALLEQCHTALGTEPVELLLAALFHSFAIVFPDRMTPTIFSEGHGRETWDSSIDMSNTVGWFTTMAPLQVPVSGDSVVDVVRRTKDVRRSVPRNGFDYFALRYLTEQGRELFGKAGPTEVLFNYLGQYQQLERSDSLLRQEALPSGAVLGDFDENLHRFALFEINAVVSHGIISVQFLYNRHMARKADVQRWIDVNTQSLKDIANILPAMAAEKTLTDFPLVPLTYDGLREIHDAVLPELGFNTIDDIEDIYPCSPMQQGLLVSQTRNSEAYKTSFKFKVLPNHTEFVDSGRLLEAWQGVVDRHAMLRTIFTERASNNGLFDQLVLVKSKANTVFIECDTDEEATSQLNNFPMVEFNNFTTPHRLLVCQSGSGKVFFRLDASHALLDAASVGALLRDIAHTYEYTQARGQGPLYSDYIKYLNSKPAEDSIKFWKKYLERVMPCYLPVHNDEPDLSVPSQLRSIRLTFSHLSVLMKRFCEKCSVTMPTVFHVAWSVVLRMYTGSEDVCYGYLVSGRDIPLNGIEESIGPFINMMVSRTHLTEESSLLELAQQKQAEYAAGIEHQSCSLAEVQHALGLSDQPLFNTMISIQNLAAKKTPEELALSFESIGSHDPTEYDVSLGIYTSDTEAEAYFGYWSAKMSDWHAENITDTFLKVLELLLENPEGNITNLRQLSDRDAQQMEHWTPLRQSEEGTLVHRLFENQVAKSPSSIAIDGFDGSFSYSELDSLSTRFSQHLIGLGVRPTDVVPLCFHKSAWAIIAMLSILRAGATCLPLAPSHPLDRMRGMLEDSEAKVVVCASDLASRLKPLGTKLVKLSPTEISQIPEAKSRHTVNIDPESSAFLLYTSGSTGVPKGVMMPHRAISTNVPVMAKNWGFNRSSRILQFVAYTFDPSIGDIFGALSTGACLCIVSEEDRMRDMTPIINSLNISHIVLTPSLARTLNPQKLAGLQFMIMGGEPITERDIAMWMDHVKLINAYGPTEATIAVTSIRYWKHKHIDPRNIGRSFLSSLAVADPDNIQHPVPIGAVGELLIGGPTLANGYLKDDEKTRRAFVKAPKWTQSTSFLGMPRMYRTGDLVRWASDGTIHFIGRKDTQIKIRGQRVEAGEIEHCIKSSLDGLKDLTVALTKPRNRSMDLVLTAFLSWETENDKTSAELMIPVTGSMKSILIDLDLKLANLLPSYMIPVLYIPVGFIPLSGTGKTDLPRLQSLVAHLSDEELSHFSLSDGPKRAPTTRMQRRLHQIWAEVLDIEPIHIGQDDGFFRIGGDSLSAIRLASLASQNDIQLNIALIFQNPKLNEMSAAAEAIKSKSVYEQLENQFSIPQDKVQDFYPCTPFQEGLMLLSMKQPGAYRERNNWTLPASTNLELFKAAFQVVSQRESILRTRIVSLESTGSLQVVINETVSISDVTSEAEFLEAEEKTPMIYGQSLMKCSILQGDGSSPRFMLTMHHALYDEWSINLILNHVESIYHSLNQTESVYSNPSPQSFSSFVDHIVQTNEQDAQTFWKSQLVGALPVDFPRLPGASYQPAKSSTFRHHMKLCRTQTSGASNSILLRAAW
jgi:amino acid adenylation domain-containing protein/non-ribosomal peptide synthase protein (TIGR01720 family)